MKLGPTEQARLLVFQVAELARRQRDRGLRLNAPEAIAIACDEMHMAARAGASFDEVLKAGKASVAPEDLMDGVAALIGEIRVEVLLKDGTRLIVLRGLGASDVEAASEPGATVVGDGTLTLNEGLSSFELEVVSHSDHVVRVSSHFPFDRVNDRLEFDREAARGSRLDIPAGDTVRWAPGETKTVRLVRVHASEAQA
jgi:urease subunit gamma/beta